MNVKDYWLRKVCENDFERLLSWRNTKRIRDMMYTDHQITREEHGDWLKRVIGGQTNSLHFVFEHRGIPLGQVNVTHIDKNNQRCYWGFYIGEAIAPKGSGLAMGYLAIDYIFNELGMHKLCSEALAYNNVSIQYHKKLGFTEEGRLRKHIFKNDSFHDVICLALFQEEWEKTKREKLNIWFNSEE